MISDNARAGMQQAPARSLFNALGFTPEEMKKPMVGIVSSFNEIVPGHMNIDKIVEAVKLGVAEAGGVPVVFPAIAVCDGIARTCGYEIFSCHKRSDCRFYRVYGNRSSV